MKIRKIAAVMTAAMLACVPAAAETTVVLDQDVPADEAVLAAEEVITEEAETAMDQALSEAAAIAGDAAAAAEQAVPAQGTYFSELTGEPISVDLQNQRPIAAMVDNESTAYDHYGIAEADVVYELMNSTENGHITRLMALVKDWGKIQQLGSIRSVRPTNIMLAAEWNAVICHDGGPFYVDEYFAKDYGKDHFSGTFSRVNNGKATEFTEYIVSGDLDSNFNNSGISRTYTNPNAEQPHFNFVPYGQKVDLSATGTAIPATQVVLPFEHTNSTLTYNAGTGTYDLSCYGKLHVDAEDGQTATFENVIIQECAFTLYDENGYMVYNVVNTGQPGYYLTEGQAIPIVWTKNSEDGVTKYFDKNGNALTINTGKTYITLVPDTMWSSLSIS